MRWLPYFSFRIKPTQSQATELVSENYLTLGDRVEAGPAQEDLLKRYARREGLVGGAGGGYRSLFWAGGPLYRPQNGL